MLSATRTEVLGKTLEILAVDPLRLSVAPGLEQGRAEGMAASCHRAFHRIDVIRRTVA
jgi:hypothetical protein